MPDVRIYTADDTLPELIEGSFFHSKEFFTLCAATPKLQPYMVVVSDEEGELCHLMATVRTRTIWLPPYLLRHCMVMGEGTYSERATEDEALFGQMLDAVMQRLGLGITYLEVSHPSQKMFAYKEFRKRGFFPVRWQDVTNSLGRRQPEERLNRRTRDRINKGMQRGAKTTEVADKEDMDQFMHLMRRHTILKLHRYLPTREFFEGLRQQGNGRLFLTRYNGKAIGCSTTVYSGSDAYFWYAAYRRKSFAFLYPHLLTIWHALADAHRRGFRHFMFVDVGLPYEHSRLRETILNFGGLPHSTYRWFHFTFGWLNKLFSRIYRG